MINNHFINYPIKISFFHKYRCTTIVVNYDMTNISKKLLSAEAHKKLLQQLSLLFLAAGERHIQALLTAVLSPAEQIMLMKRVAVVLLLHKEKTTYYISKRLLVSDRTVRVVKKEMQAGRYDPLIALVSKKQFDQKKFWSTLEKIVTLGMPTYNENRAAYLRKIVKS